MTAKTHDTPTSAEQIAANRANARHSTGPRTEAGKEIAARNALVHGLRADTPVLPDEDQAEFEQLRRTLAADLAPAGMLERALVERMAGLLWRLARTGRMESAMLAHEHARRAHVLARERAEESDPGETPDWEWLREQGASPPAPVNYTEPYMVERIVEWNDAHAAHADANQAWDAAWEHYRGMLGPATISHFLHNPQALETLSRYEVGIYRQFEATLRQFWIVAGGRRRRPAEGPPEIVQEVPSTETVPDDAAPAAENP